MTRHKAYGLLQIKAMDDDAREITGIASTITPDRMDDVVEAKGAIFKLPIPLLWQHDRLQPIGQVTEAKVTPEGIKIKAKLAKLDAPSQLAARLEEAWQSIKAGLVRGLSIGFKPVEYTVIESTGGLRFTAWDWLELSAVTIPANSEASIQTVKSFDTDSHAASGIKTVSEPKDKSASVVVNLQPKKTTENKEMPKKTGEQIAAFQTKRAELQDKMKEIMAKADEEGRTLNEKESEEFDECQAEINSVSKHLERLETLRASEVKTTVAVKSEAGETEKASKEVRTQTTAPVVKTARNQKGITFVRAVKAYGAAKGNMDAAMREAARMYPNDGELAEMMKAAVAAGTTLNNTWAKPLVPTEAGPFADFVEFLRPQTILGKFGTGNIPSLRNVPFRTRLISQTSGGSASWVGEGNAKPVTKFDFAGTTLLPLKVANISVATMELLRDSSPAADGLIQSGLADAIRAVLDNDFIDPTKAAVSNISPASILNGVTPIASSGTDADAIRADLRALWTPFLAANNPPTSGVYIMSSLTALALSLMVNPLGQPEFPGITINGGMLLGTPVIVSDYLPTDTSGSIVALVNASDIYEADEGGIEISISTEASLQMDTAPTMDSDTPTATSVVSMFQTNSVAFRAERTINWAKRRPSAAQYLSGVNWGA